MGQLEGTAPKLTVLALPSRIRVEHAGLDRVHDLGGEMKESDASRAVALGPGPELRGSQVSVDEPGLKPTLPFQNRETRVIGVI
jgi:hypothetical protein